MTGTTDLDICNQALSFLATGYEIQDLVNEASAEAQACRRFKDTTIQEVLRSYPWPFSTKFATLTVVQANPTAEWAYSYRYPSDCVMARRIVSGIRRDTHQSRVPYKLGQDSQGMLIFCDYPNAILEYTGGVPNQNLYQPDFVTAVALLLATKIASRLTAGDPFGLAAKCMAQYQQWLSLALANAINEEQPDQEPESEFIRSRDGGGPPTTPSPILPFGS